MIVFKVFYNLKKGNRTIKRNPVIYNGYSEDGMILLGQLRHDLKEDKDNDEEEVMIDKIVFLREK